ncbi:MAG: hypothetical protein ABIJ97_05810 [Bacteroidota bacterium]
MKPVTFILLFSLLFFIFQSCKNEGENIDISGIDTTKNVVEKKGMTVFIGMPSPIETSLILKRSGAKFDESLLNPPQNKGNYTSGLSQALNLGVYSADMCFSSMYNQSQTSIKYLASTKKLAEDLGLMDAINQSTFERMEANANFNDSLMYILSEIIMNAEMTLKESDRKEVAAIILAGGWIEGLYLTTQIAKNTEINDELMIMVVDHRLSLDALIKLLNQFVEDESFSALTASMEELKTIFDKIEITSTAIEVETDVENKESYLHSKTDAIMSPAVFEEISVYIKKVRTNIVLAETI